MRSVILGALGCVSSFVPSIVALNVPRPNHAAAGLLVVPNNLTIMTPRDTSSMLERQLFDFGSPFSNGFSGLRHLAARQGCNAATEGGIVVGAEFAARLDLFVTVGDAAYRPRLAATTRDAAIETRIAVQEEAVAQAGVAVLLSMANLGAVRMDKHAESPSATARAIPPAQMNPSAVRLDSDPNAQTGTTVMPLPSSSVAASLTTTRKETSISEPTSHLSTRSEASPTRAHVPTTGTAQTTQTNGSGAVFAQSQSTPNVGAIAGGTVAGVMVLVLMLIFLIVWRRKQSNGAADSEIPTGNPASEPSNNPAYSPDAVPPTPGTVDPFLTPMNQHQNIGISYFPGSVDRPASGPGLSPHYTGLPEPQHGDDMGVAVGTTTMPVPRHDIHHPHPLPMRVTSLREPAADSGPTGVWSSFIPSPSPPSRQSDAHGGGNTPTPSGWSNNEITNTNSVYSNPPGASNPYGSTPPPRAPSTVYQPLPEGGQHNGNLDLYPPPASPPPDYPRAYAGNSGDLPGGAAPPVTNFTPGEKSL